MKWSSNALERNSGSGVRIKTATVLKEILQKRRDKGAAKRLLVALMKRYDFAPKRIITDKSAHGAAKAEVALRPWPLVGQGLNRAENICRFENGTNHARPPIIGALQRFVSIFSDPQLFLCSISSPSRTHNSLPSPRSFRCMENCGLFRPNIYEPPGLSGQRNLT